MLIREESTSYTGGMTTTEWIHPRSHVPVISVLCSVAGVLGPGDATLRGPSFRCTTAEEIADFREAINTACDIAIAHLEELREANTRNR